MTPSRSVRYFLAFFLLVVHVAACADTLTGRVVSVADGDTVTVLSGRNKKHNVRIAGIEAPEKAQPYGKRSNQHLTDLVFDKTVSVEWHKYDPYGRIFGKVMVAAPNACPAVQPDCPKTLDVGLAQIVGGYAWQYRHAEGEQTPQERAAYSFAEKVARSKRVGLWADTAPMSPWQWRSDHKLVK